MILWKNFKVNKEVLWDHVAQEFEYYCQVCGERPGFRDSHCFLSVGTCRACDASSDPVLAIGHSEALTR